MQAVKATTINTNLMCVTLGNKCKVLSTYLVKLSISFTSVATLMVWCCVVPDLSAPVILGMSWLTQINPKINWSEKTTEWTSKDINVFLEAFDSGRTRGKIG